MHLHVCGCSVFLCEIRALAAKCWDKYQLFSGAPFSLCFGPVIVTVTCVSHEVCLEAISGSSGTILNLDDAAFWLQSFVQKPWDNICVVWESTAMMHVTTTEKSIQKILWSVLFVMFRKDKTQKHWKSELSCSGNCTEMRRVNWLKQKV